MGPHERKLIEFPIVTEACLQRKYSNRYGTAEQAVSSTSTLCYNVCSGEGRLHHA